MRTYDMNWLYNNLSVQEAEYLFFWKPEKNTTITKACMSQWTYSPFVVENIHYLTAEHWMMAKKAELFADKDICMKILSCQSPSEVQILGKKIKNFDQIKWEKHRLEIVINSNFHKFSQNEYMKMYLLGTENKILVEASPLDRIWGIGLSEEDQNADNPYIWRGINLLGFALMEVRDKLRKNEK